jgi:hypothetical protein
MQCQSTELERRHALHISSTGQIKSTAKRVQESSYLAAEVAFGVDKRRIAGRRIHGVAPVVSLHFVDDATLPLHEIYIQFSFVIAEIRFAYILSAV